VDEPSVLATVPMWFGLLDEAKADAMITQLADLDHQADWGMRIISEHSPQFSGGGYHFGSVWPLFTGWAAVGEYRYHRSFPAYANFRANALLASMARLGTSRKCSRFLLPIACHELTASDLVRSNGRQSMLRGMFGLRADVTKGTVAFEPHTPADWTSFGIRNVQLGSARWICTIPRMLKESGWK